MPRAFGTTAIWTGTRLEGCSERKKVASETQGRHVLQIKHPRSGLWDYGPQQHAEEEFGDFVDATWAIGQLQAEHNKPLFLAVGLYRPRSS